MGSYHNVVMLKKAAILTTKFNKHSHVEAYSFFLRISSSSLACDAFQLDVNHSALRFGRADQWKAGCFCAWLLVLVR